MNGKRRTFRSALAALGLLILPLGFAFQAPAAYAGRFAYIPNAQGVTVSVIDTTTNTVAADPAVAGFTHWGVAVHPAGTRVYVTNSNSNNVVVLDTATNTVVATIAVGSLPRGIAVTPSGAFAYVANQFGNSVSVINTSSNAVIATVPVGTNPIGVAIDPAGAFAYVANLSSNTVSVIDTVSNAVVAAVGVNGNASGIAVHPAGTFVYVANDSASAHYLSVIDTATRAVVANIAVGLDPMGVTVDPAGSFVYVANENSNSVSVIATATNSVVATVPVGSSPLGISIDGAGTSVYVANTVTNDVSVIDTVTRTVIATIPVGITPIAMGKFVGGPQAFVPNAPTIGTAVAGDGQAAVSFAAPSFDGLAPITSYTVTCTPGPVSAAGAASPITVTGLANGTAYACTVAATNAAGTGPASGSVSVTPVGVPSVAPSITSGASTGFTVGSAGTFTVTATGTPAPTLSLSGALPSGVTFTPATGVLAGTPVLGTVGTYPLTLTAANGTLPNASQSFTLAVTKAAQSIAFTGPATQTLGPALVALTATSSSGLAVGFASATPAVCSVAGSSVTLISAGTCTISAGQAGDPNYNAASSVQQSFQVVTVPGAPAIGAATPGNGQATIAFAAPASDGGLPITGYTVTCNPGAISATASASPIVVTGLVNGSAYSCSVTAANAAGSSMSSASVGVTPAAPATFSLTVSPASVDFGAQSMGTVSPEVAVQLDNNGTGAVTIAAVAVSDPQFVQVNGCGTLQPGARCVILVAFAPAVTNDAVNVQVTAAGTLSITSNAARSPATIPLAGIGQKSLVAHYYERVLGRGADAGGMAFWADQATRLSALGANVNETWFALAATFFNSPEYVALHRTDDAFVADLYETFLNRPGDPGGVAYWTGQLAAGLPREVLMATFMFSAEYTTFTRSIFGNTAARPEVDMVMDWFRGILGRLPDTQGFNYWLHRLRVAQCTGAAAVYAEADEASSLFVWSAEYATRGRNERQFVGDLYNAFLRRGGELDGVDFWIAQVTAGTLSREDLRRRFLASPEFAARVQSIINAGCMP